MRSLHLTVISILFFCYNCYLVQVSAVVSIFLEHCGGNFRGVRRFLAFEPPTIVIPARHSPDVSLRLLCSPELNLGILISSPKALSTIHADWRRWLSRRWSAAKAVTSSDSKCLSHIQHLFCWIVSSPVLFWPLFRVLFVDLASPSHTLDLLGAFLLLPPFLPLRMFVLFFPVFESLFRFPALLPWTFFKGMTPPPTTNSFVSSCSTSTSIPHNMTSDFFLGVTLSWSSQCVLQLDHSADRISCFTSFHLMFSHHVCASGISLYTPHCIPGFSLAASSISLGDTRYVFYQLLFYGTLLAPTSSLALDPVLNDLPKLTGMPGIGDYPSILALSIHVTDPFLSTIICLWKHPFVDFILLLRACLKASASAIFGNTLAAFGRPCISLEGTSAWAFNETDNVEDVLMDCPMTLTIVEDFRLRICRLKYIIYVGLSGIVCQDIKSTSVHPPDRYLLLKPNGTLTTARAVLRIS
jgi:hypothetical protein